MPKARILRIDAAFKNDAKPFNLLYIEKITKKLDSRLFLKRKKPNTKEDISFF